MGAQATDGLCDILSVRRDSPAFAARQILRGIKAETGGIAQFPRSDAITRRLQGVGGILQQKEVAPPAKLRQSFDIDHQTVEMHGQDPSRTGCDGTLDLFDVEIARLRLDVHEHRGCTGVKNSVRRGDEGHRCRDDLVVGAHAKRLQTEKQRCRAAGEADDPLNSQVLRQ